MNDQIKVIIQASLVPVDGIVTKINGTHMFKLSKQFKIFSDDAKQRKVLNAEEGTLFLIDIDARADISCIPTTTELIWLTTEDELYSWLSERVDRD